MTKQRPDHEPPESTTAWGWKYHHLGIPTNNEMPGETYIPKFKVYVSGFRTSPFGIEWMRYEAGSPVNRLVRTVPHVAFEVNDLEHEIRFHDLKVITSSNSPSDGVKVAMIEHNGAPVELIEFTGKKKQFSDAAWG
jgi:hypothetical protein